MDQLCTYFWRRQLPGQFPDNLWQEWSLGCRSSTQCFRTHHYGPECHSGFCRLRRCSWQSISQSDAWSLLLKIVHFVLGKLACTLVFVLLVIVFSFPINLAHWNSVQTALCLLVSSRFMLARFNPEFSSHVQIVHSHWDCILMLQVQPQSWVFVSTSITLILCLTSQSLGRLIYFQVRSLWHCRRPFSTWCLLPFSALLFFTLAFSQLKFLAETVYWITWVSAGNSNIIVNFILSQNWCGKLSSLKQKHCTRICIGHHKATFKCLLFSNPVAYASLALRPSRKWAEGLSSGWYTPVIPRSKTAIALARSSRYTGHSL